jgi:signal transduction histidine kinase
MNDSRASQSVAELLEKRKQISQGLRRLNTSAIVILLITVALAFAAILESRHSERERLRAEAAERDARQKLFQTHLAQAHAERMNESMGRRWRAESAIEAAVTLRRTLPGIDPAELRNEAIATLALDDIEVSSLVHSLPGERAPYCFDGALNRYAVGWTNGDVTLHRFSDGTLLSRFASPVTNGGVAEISFADRERSLLVLYRNGSLFAFSTSTNLPGRRLNVRSAKTIEASSLGPWVAVVTKQGAARIFDLHDDDKVIGRFSNVVALAMHPRAKMIALDMHNRIRFLDFNGLEMLPPLTNHVSVTQLAFHPDGAQIAVANPYFGVTLWNLVTREPTSLRAPLGDFYGLHYSPDGHSIAAALGDGVSRVWSTRTGELLHKLSGGRIVAFARDSDHIAFERPGEGIGMGRIIRSPVLRPLQWNTTSEYFRRFWSVDFSEDDRYVAAVDALGLVVWDVESRRMVAHARTPIRPLTVAWLKGRDSWLVSSSTNAAIYPMRTNDELRATTNIALAATPNSLGQSALSPDGNFLAVVTESKTATLIDLRQPERRIPLHYDGPGSLGHFTFSPDGKWLASSATEGYALLVWESATGQLVQKIPGPHGRVLFNPCRSQLVLGTAREYSFWNTDTWQPLAGSSIARDNFAETTGALAFSPDGKRLAVARTRQLVQMVDSVTGRDLALLAAPQLQTISWLHFSPTGDRLAAATFDGSIQLWDLAELSRRLSQWGLGWEAPNVVPLAIRAPGRSALFILPPIGVVLVLVFVIYAFRRQSQLFAAYVHVDELAAQRTTELRAAQTEIVHAQKMKALGTLAAGIAHDFNNLLSVIRLSNQLTGEEAKDNASIRENVAEIDQAVAQGKRVVHSMLGYSREQESSGPFVLSDLVEDTVALLSKQFLNGIMLTLELDRDLPAVRLSRNRLEQALLNLIVNASEAMKGRGHLQIRLRAGAGPGEDLVLRPRMASTYAELLLIDSGPGIAQDILPRIFEPFFTTKTRGAVGGTGLGLSTVYTIAEQDGLGLGVKSVSGQGTEFRIILPLDEGTSPHEN